MTAQYVTGGSFLLDMKPYYQDEAVTIYHGDCREILPALPNVDLVLTDPPYGVGVDYGPGKSADKNHDFKDVLEACRALAGRVIWTPGSVNMVEWIAATRPYWVGAWFKPNQCSRSPLGFGAWEPVCFYFERGLGEYVHLGQDAWLVPIAQQGAAKGHPCPKSLKFWKMLFASDVQTVLDPFMGSGTTLRAAKDLGCKAIGIDINEAYCELAANRMAQSVLSFEKVQGDHINDRPESTVNAAEGGAVLLGF